MENPGGTSRADRLKRIVREAREGSQMRALPSALPGQEVFEHQLPLGGLAISDITVCTDPPGDPKDLLKHISGFFSKALGPTFLSYGPMLAEGDFVVEEWESLAYASNGTVYNNQYLWILRFEGDQPASMLEYNDTHHASIIIGIPGEWDELKPSTAPRRRNRHGAPAPSDLPPSEIETVFEVADQFDLDPALLRDVVPTGASPPMRVEPGIEGNKALIRGLHQALASGDQAAVNSFHGEGFRHFIAGERPFGWDHLPLEEIYAPLVEHLASPLTLRYGPMVADETRVFEQMDSFAQLDDGSVYNNWHALVHEIRDGRIIQTREYMDTRHLWVTLGRWAKWGDIPVPPRSTPRRSNLQGIAATVQIPMFGLDLERWRPFPPAGSLRGAE